MAYIDTILADSPKFVLGLQDAATGSGAILDDTSTDDHQQCIVDNTYGSIAARATGPNSGAAIPYAATFTASGAVKLRDTGPARFLVWMDTTTYTMEAWINTTMATWTQDRTIIGETQSVSSFHYVRMCLDVTSKKLKFTRNSAVGAESVTMTSGSALNDGNWHHVAVTVAGTTVKLYVDGAEVTTTGSFTNNSLTTTSTYAWLGNMNDLHGATTRGWQGDMAYAAGYRTALSATRILAHYNAGLTDPPANTVAPAVTGGTTPGSTLSCTTGTWTGSPSGYAYQWKKNGSNVGTDSSTYTISANAGDTITCTVTASNAGGSASQISNTITVTALPSGGGFAALIPIIARRR